MTQPAERHEPSQTPRQALVARLEELQATFPDEGPSELADRLVPPLYESDRHIIDDFLRAEVSAILKYELRAQTIRTRQGIFRSLSIANPDAEAALEQTEPESDTDTPRHLSVFERISGWMEFAPNQHGVLPVLHMTRDDLQASIRYDRQQAHRFTWKAIVKEKLELRLEGSQMVRDVWSNEEIGHLILNAQKEASSRGRHLRQAE